MTAEELIALLGLRPHPVEGGYFVETYRSPESLETIANMAGTRRSLSTAIYYLMTPGTFSALHRLAADEIFHFYLGDPVEMLQLSPDGQGKLLTLGPDVGRAMKPQVLVPRGCWQGAGLLPGGAFALLGTTMSPGFEYSDYETGVREDLIAAYPDFREWIVRLTR